MVFDNMIREEFPRTADVYPAEVDTDARQLFADTLDLARRLGPRLAGDTTVLTDGSTVYEWHGITADTRGDVIGADMQIGDVELVDLVARGWLVHLDEYELTSGMYAGMRLRSSLVLIPFGELVYTGTLHDPEAADHPEQGGIRGSMYLVNPADFRSIGRSARDLPFIHRHVRDIAGRYGVGMAA